MLAAAALPLAASSETTSPLSRRMMELLDPPFEVARALQAGWRAGTCSMPLRSRRRRAGASLARTSP
eukprot:14683533-Alexandrium_andersonii.AAC.1